MKRALVVLGAVILFVQTLVIPAVVKADGGTGTTGCGKTLCKP